MRADAEHAPRWVNTLVGWPVTAFLARVALASAFLIGGIAKLSDFQGAVAEQTHFGLQPAPVWAVLAIIVEIGGSLLLIAGRWVWLAAGALSVLTAVAIVVANDFWAQHGPAQFAALNSFFERLGLIGGFALAAILAHRQKAGSP